MWFKTQRSGVRVKQFYLMFFLAVLKSGWFSGSFLQQQLSETPSRLLLLCPWSQSGSRLWLAPVWSFPAPLLPQMLFSACGDRGWKSGWFLNQGISTIVVSLSTVKTRVKSASNSRTGCPCSDTPQGETAPLDWKTYSRLMPRGLRSHWRGRRTHIGAGEENSRWRFWVSLELLPPHRSKLLQWVFECWIIHKHWEWGNKNIYSKMF